MNTFWKPVKNFTKGRNGQKILCVVEHITDGNAWQTYNTFQNEPKSSHYLVLRNGDIWQFVKEEDIAWHSGLKVRPTAKIILENLDKNVNSYSIGIEHEAFGYQDLTEIQYVVSGKLLGEICQRWEIPLDREHILPHNSIRSDKVCPGIISISKLIGLAQSPPQLSEISELQIKLSLLQKILELLKSIISYKKLGNIDTCELEK